MGIFRTIFGDGGPWMRDCPICGEFAGSKPGGFTSFFGISAFGGDGDREREAVRYFEDLVRENPGAFVCWPAVVAMFAAPQGLIEFRQVWENNHPGDRGHVWQAITKVLEGSSRHNPVVY